MQYVRQVGSYEYATFWNMKMEADKITDPQKYFTREDIEAFRTGQDPMLHPNIDWMDYLFNKVFSNLKIIFLYLEEQMMSAILFH